MCTGKYSGQLAEAVCKSSASVQENKMIGVFSLVMDVVCLGVSVMMFQAVTEKNLMRIEPLLKMLITVTVLNMVLGYLDNRYSGHANPATGWKLWGGLGVELAVFVVFVWYINEFKEMLMRRKGNEFV